MAERDEPFTFAVDGRTGRGFQIDAASRPCRVASHRDRRRRNGCRARPSGPTAPRCSSTSTDRWRRSSNDADDARAVAGRDRRCSARLAAGLGRVAVVSGRPVEFLARQLPVDGLALVGLYGMEQSVDGAYAVDPRVRPYLVAVAAATAELEARAAAGVSSSRKSGISVTLHWRPAPDRAEAHRRARATRSRRRHGLAELRDRAWRSSCARRSTSTRAPRPTTLVAGLDVAAFAGDDRGDLPAFAALDARGGRRPVAARGPHRGARRARRRPSWRTRSISCVDGPVGLLALTRPSWRMRSASQSDG